jgi:hypothetical protein
MAHDAYDAYLAELKAATEEMRVGPAADVQRVHDLVGAMGQAYTTTMFALTQTTTMKSAVSFALDMVQKHAKTDWTRTVAAATLKSPLGTLRSRYKLLDTADLIEKAAGLVKDLDDTRLVELLRWVNQYITFLIRRIRSMMPFYELSIAFEGHRFMVEKAVPPGTSGK